MPEFLDEKDKKVLELDIRRNIYHTIKGYAGCHFRELERISKLPAGTLKYHLDYLAKHNLINREKEGNNLRFFPREFNPENKKMMTLLRQQSIRKILLFIMQHQGCIHEQIVSSSHLSPSTTSHHLRKLEDEGIISAKKEGRKTHFHLIARKEDIMLLLIAYKESFLDAVVDRVVEMWDVG